MLLADRFYPSATLFAWLRQNSWSWRIRLKGNLCVDVGDSAVNTTGDLATGVRERCEVDARLFEVGVITSIGVLHEPGHPQPWIIAMDQPPSRASVLDYGARWAIEPMFSDFKTRGFRLESTHLQAHLSGSIAMMLIMALAIYWCVNAGRADALQNPTPTEKSPGADQSRARVRAQGREKYALMVQARFAFVDSSRSQRRSCAAILQFGVTNR